MRRLNLTEREQLMPRHKAGIFGAAAKLSLIVKVFRTPA